MSDDITGLCRAHSFETATDLCRRCGLEFCEICVVHPFGPKKPYCKECAMALGGVRTHVTRQALPTRQVRKRVKAFEAFLKGRQTTLTTPAVPDLVDPTIESAAAPTPEPVPAGAPAMDDALLDTDFDAGQIPPPPPPPVGDNGPGDGVAPPIDWNQPFG